MNTLIPGAPLRSLSPTSNEYQRAEGVSRAAKPARVARFTLDAPEHSGTIPGARGDILTPGVALTSNLAVIFTLNQHMMTSRQDSTATPFAVQWNFCRFVDSLLPAVGLVISGTPAGEGGSVTVKLLLRALFVSSASAMLPLGSADAVRVLSPAVATQPLPPFVESVMLLPALRRSGIVRHGPALGATRRSRSLYRPGETLRAATATPGEIGLRCETRQKLPLLL